MDTGHETTGNSSNNNENGEKWAATLASVPFASANEASGQNEKNFYTTDTEFSPENTKTFREKLLFADPETTQKIISERIEFLEETCDRTPTISADRFDQHMHRGYIGSDTKVQFEASMVTMGSSYKLKDTAYLYEAVEHLQNHKESINNGIQFFHSIEDFLNSYFGLPDETVNRMDVIYRKADLLDPNIDDKGYFQRLNNIDISIFKHEYAAQCSERSAMAQNIMSLFGYGTYYTNGTISVDGRPEYHAYNIVADDVGQKNIVDYSVTSSIEYRGTSWLVPSQGKILDFNSFQAGQKIHTVSYQAHIDDEGKITRQPIHNLEYTVT